MTPTKPAPDLIRGGHRFLDQVIAGHGPEKLAPDLIRGGYRFSEKTMPAGKKCHIKVAQRPENGAAERLNG
jgi:hypothetical protein